MKNILYILLVLTISCNTKRENKEIAIQDIAYPDSEWLSTNLEFSEKNKIKIDSLNNVFEKKYSLLIIKNGKSIFESYQAPYLKDSLIHVNSCTKSVVSMLFGMVFRDNLILNENKSSISYFPEFQINNPAIQKIKNNHFLSMSSGLDWNGGIDATDVIAMSQSEDWAKYVFEREVKSEPNENYRYNSGGTQVISSILHKQVSNDLENFAKDSLFTPIGIKEYFWDKTLNGIPKAGWGLHLKMRDMAKLGYLMLNGGVWKRKQIIPEYWVDQSTTSQMKIDDMWHYGYQFWIPQDFEYKSYLFRGYYPPSHKIIQVIPELDVVAVYVGENSNFKEVIKTHIEILEEECARC